MAPAQIARIAAHRRRVEFDRHLGAAARNQQQCAPSGSHHGALAQRAHQGIVDGLARALVDQPENILDGFVPCLARRSTR